MKKIFHLTSSHTRYDTRIFLKECISISRNGYATYLFVSDDQDDEIINKVSIHNLNIKRYKSRLLKIIFFYKNFLKTIQNSSPVIIHFHDPELLFLGAILKSKGFKIIYDIHENTHLQILEKSYLPKALRGFFSSIFFYLERKISQHFDGIVYATQGIKNFHLNYSGKNQIINNFPLVDEFNCNVKQRKNSKEIIFVGGINKIRGIIPLIKSIYKSEIKLNLVGNFLEKDLLKTLERVNGWSNVNYFGYCNRDKINELMARSIVGIVTFLNAPNHVDSQPNKIFEYMSAGLPVIASNFDLWREIIEKNNCGFCVNPTDLNEIKSAIFEILGNPRKAKELGENGRRAIIEKYNWNNEEKKLIKLYGELI